MIRNFIFDVDRTLIDSYKPELETLQEALLIVTKKEYGDNVMNKLTMLTTDEFFAGLGIDTKSELMKQINYHWARLLETRKLHFFEGIKEILIKLKGGRILLRNCYFQNKRRSRRAGRTIGIYSFI